VLAAKKNIHLVSDSTGETLHALAQAGLALFSGAEVDLHMSVFVRSEQDLAEVTELIRLHPGLIFFTLIDKQHRNDLLRVASELGLVAIPVLDPLISALSSFLESTPAQRAGMQHQLNDAYFSRISALDFAIAHDDGALGERLRVADVILTGVSRTSKTPTCIYLAYRGIKAANMPLVPKQLPPKAFHEAMQAGVPAIGLTASPNRLAQIRQQRLDALGDQSHDYADLDQIRDEVAEARLFFQRHDIPVIDVTRRSIEETAAEIQAILRIRESSRE